MPTSWSIHVTMRRANAHSRGRLLEILNYEATVQHDRSNINRQERRLLGPGKPRSGSSISDALEEKLQETHDSCQAQENYRDQATNTTSLESSRPPAVSPSKRRVRPRSMPLLVRLQLTMCSLDFLWRLLMPLSHLLLSLITPLASLEPSPEIWT